MSHQLLVEQILPQEGNIITEVASNIDSNGVRNVWLQGVFMQAVIQNRNGRIYPLSEIANAVKTACGIISELGGIFGELDHPENLQINMDRISHVITELYMDGSNAIGKAKLLDTPMGLIAKELARSGVRYGISSRGAGNLNESKTVSQYHFITADLVAIPSAAGALPKPVFEALELSKHGSNIITLSESIKEDNDAQKYFKKAIMDFLNEGVFKNHNK